MEIDENFNLDYGQRIIFKKKTGYKVVEFCRHPDKETLDNIVEIWSYDSRKPKGQSTWIILKDLSDHLRPHIKEYGSPILETFVQKTDKKK
jgi:hypothetical protein